jgi:serine protein kinase
MEAAGMDHNKEFEALIKKDRDLHQSRSWRGNLLGYLEKVKADPTVAKLAHARLYDTIMKPGVRDIHENSDPHVKRLYKDDFANRPLLSCRVAQG